MFVIARVWAPKREPVCQRNAATAWRLARALGRLVPDAVDDATGSRRRRAGGLAALVRRRARTRRASVSHHLRARHRKPRGPKPAAIVNGEVRACRVAQRRPRLAAPRRLIMGPGAAQIAGGHAGGSSGNCGRQFYAEGRVLGSRTGGCQPG